MAPQTDSDEELLAIIRESVPPKKAKQIAPAATLRQLGIDSLTMVIIIGRFIADYPIEVEPLQDRFTAVKTIGQLLELGRVARDMWRREHGQP